MKNAEQSAFFCRFIKKHRLSRWNKKSSDTGFFTVYLMCKGGGAVWALFPIIWNYEYRMAVALKFGRQELYVILKMVLLKWYDNFVTERVFLYKNSWL